MAKQWSFKNKTKVCDTIGAMDPLLLSRFQFGDTAAFHILWPLISIGLSLYMLLLETQWLRTKNEKYYRQIKFWSKIFVLTFVIGTASGIPLEFEFGTNWAAFSAAAGDFFGNILGFESTVAFALEAAFLGIFVFGWKRVRPGMHLFANAMVALGATLSGFWIVVANSWMQIPQGVVVENGKIIVTDYWSAIFNPDSIVSFFHMQFACIETTLFFIAGLCALALLRKGTSMEYQLFFIRSFIFALGIMLVITPLQMIVGDASGGKVAKFQPEKLAAIEMHWDTNLPGEGAPLSLLAWPAREGGENSFDVQIPYLLSLLTTHSLTGTVQGLNDFPEDARPTRIESILVFYSFRIMVGAGIAMFVLMIIGAWYWFRKKLQPENIPRQKLFWWLWVLATPLGFLATEAGWMVREIGRQPWIVYHILRTEQGLSSNLNATAVGATTIIFTLLYTIFGIIFMYFTWKIVKKGPDFENPAPRL